jgi:hypothetical protein
MRNLIRNRRGVSAFATVIALTPLIGVMALGAEAGSWYVTKQHAQNAADAAAYSGGLALACTLSGSSCTDAYDYAYRGKEFAAQNNFCNAGDTSYPGANCPALLPSGTSQSVRIERGTWVSPTWSSSASGSYVRATVQQIQPAYLAAVLGRSSVTIGGQAIAYVDLKKDICGLGLGRSGTKPPLTIGGSFASGGTGCGLMSDKNVNLNSTPFFTGSGWALYGATGCSPGTCADPGVPYNYYMPPANNPLSKLDSESFNSNPSGSNKDPCKNGPYPIQPNTPTTAYGACTVTTGNTVTFTSGGTYFFYNAAIKINGGTVTGSNINIVLLGNSSVSISGGTVTLSANTNNTTYPDLNGVLIDDQAPNKSNNAVTVNGGGTVKLGGAMYFPNVDVTWGGTAKSDSTTCAELIGNTLTMTGGAYLSVSGCTPGTIPKTQVVALVQ